MNLTNIHNRKDFKKLYEIGGTAGGTGGADGFADNTAMKDTLVGKAINGLFRGISWLWRKSKEFFVVNKLIAKVINELTRGVIIYAFDNNIDLVSGALAVSGTTEATEEKETAKKETAEEIEETDPGKHPDIIPEVLRPKGETHGVRLIDRIKAVKTKEEYETIKIEVDDRYIKDKKYIRYQQRNIDTNNMAITSAKKDKKEGYLDKIKFLNEESNARQRKIDKTNEYELQLKDALALKAKELGIKPEPEKDDFERLLEPIKKDCGTFNPNKPSKEELTKLNIKIDLHTVTVPTEINKIKSDAKAFLEAHVLEYSKMNDEQKKKMQIIYMNYEIINSLSKKLVKESYKYMNEATVTTRMDSPEAGNVNVAKSIGSKIGVVKATVGDILTKRDKEKYKEKEDQFDVDVSSINLAEIEKIVRGIGQDARNEVATDVNAENMKVIQLTAKELFVPTESGGKTDDHTKLKIKWDKELSKVYAGFSEIMAIKVVDIRENDFRSELDANKDVREKAEHSSKGLNSSVEAMKIADTFDAALNPNQSKLSDLKGEWAYYVFSYKKNYYYTSIADVKPIKGMEDFYLLMLTKCFTGPKVEDHSVVDNDATLFSLFKSKYADTNTISAGQKSNVFLMMNKNTQFPTGTSKEKTNSILVLNNIINGTESKIYLSDLNTKKCVSITDTLVKTFKFAEYKVQIQTITCRKFVVGASDEWKPALNLISDISKYNFCDFQAGKQPVFLNDDKVLANLGAIAKATIGK